MGSLASRKTLPALGCRSVRVWMRAPCSKASRDTSVSARSREYSLVPAVCVFTANSQPVTLSVNFTGPFEVSAWAAAGREGTLMLVLVWSSCSFQWMGLSRMGSRDEAPIIAYRHRIQAPCLSALAKLYIQCTLTHSSWCLEAWLLVAARRNRVLVRRRHRGLLVGLVVEVCVGTGVRAV